MILSSTQGPPREANLKSSNLASLACLMTFAPERAKNADKGFITAQSSTFRRKDPSPARRNQLTEPFM